jgi:hypothetical protein
MAWVGWYFLVGAFCLFLVLLLIPIPETDTESTRKREGALGGVMLLMIWPVILLTAALEAWGKRKK